MKTSNFTFLENEFPSLFGLARAAEYQLYADPGVSLFKQRQLLEQLTTLMIADHQLDRPFENTLFNRLRLLDQEDLLPGHLRELAHRLRKQTNAAVHPNGRTFVANEALASLKTSFKILKWFFEVYSTEIRDVSALVFSIPEKLDARHALRELEGQYETLKLQFEELLANKQQAEINQQSQAHKKDRGRRAASKIDWNEADTRELIDEQLRQAGWKTNSVRYNYKNNRTIPRKGENLAIAEWPCGKLWADYALFVGAKLVGLVEAKKYGVDISADLGQTKTYAREVTADKGAQLCGEWYGYRVPFMYATNGREFLKQIATKSGIWFLDGRHRYDTSKPLRGWHGPEDLMNMLSQDRQMANEKLVTDDLDYLKSKAGLSLRDYQIKAISAVEKVIVNEPNRRRALLTMATGTGKTRTAIGLCYRLIKSNRFRRILFLVDRRLLAEQAFNNFKDNKVENLNTFAEIYEVKDLTSKIPDLDTRLHFATVQSLVKRLFHDEGDRENLPVGTYDCIIVDEAHRGYTEDRDLDEDELVFKNQNDYVSQYRKVLEYFDAFALGLTATPALHTTELFGGSAVFTYTYSEAVLDGYLVDQEPPYVISTELNQEGISWQAGERPNAYDRETNSIEALESLEDELHVDVTGFNKTVITDSFNRTVASYLAGVLDPDDEQKTLIFAARQEHAEMIANFLKEAFNASGVPVEDDAISVLTGRTYQVRKAVKKFRNERYPSIAITVDLLTTGIDVPAIANLVFLRRVSSRILYEQMIGRATRLHPASGKESFRIYDAVRLYDDLQQVTQMRPVVVNPQASFTDLSEEINGIPTAARTRRQIEQLIGKMRRKERNFGGQDLEEFTQLTSGRDPDQLAEYLLNTERPIGEAKKSVTELSGLWGWLDQRKAPQRYQLVSDHADQLREVTRGFGPQQQSAGDYLNDFQEFVNNNRNRIAALNIICTAPTQLDRKALKEVQLALVEAGFRKQALNEAWKESRHEDVAADIIAFVRTLAMGNTLVAPEVRITGAMNRIKNSREWTKTQRNWLDKIELQLRAETVLQVEDLNRDPFSQAGGFDRLNKIFLNELPQVIKQINEELYREVG